MRIEHENKRRGVNFKSRKMQLRTAFNWSLLGFLVLFLNLGQWAHHAPIFHFHDEDQVARSGCCCCSNSGLAPPTSTECGDEPAYQSHSGNECGSCIVCEFFKKYSATCWAESVDLTSSFVSALSSPRQSFGLTDAITSTARGPPCILG